jgi:hypothetical protein
MDHGKYIFGDYDLYDIVRPEHPRGNLAAIEELEGERHMRGPTMLKVQSLINQRIKVEMIRHGGDAQFRKYTGDTLEAYGPDGEFRVLTDEAGVRALYESEFEGRQVIDMLGSSSHDCTAADLPAAEDGGGTGGGGDGDGGTGGDGSGGGE